VVIDIRLIRENPKEVQEAISSLGADAPIDAIARLDERRRDILQELEDLRHQRNVTSKQIGQMKYEVKRKHLI
jgi:seryl-tRNA synthetase